LPHVLPKEVNVKKAVEITGKDEANFQSRCKEGSLAGAHKVNRSWMIPYANLRGVYEIQCLTYENGLERKHKRLAQKAATSTPMEDAG
jgi:hypothetical protein